jgi:glycosyltransferase involved in cell wall biosynthesis
MKVALVHDWLVRCRGGERVLEAICELYPNAELFTLLHQPGSVPAVIENRPIHTSFLQRMPGIERSYPKFLPLFPTAISSFDLSGFDLVISSSHCVAKGIRKANGARHLSYVHAPMRYVWDRFDDYFGQGHAGPLTRAGARAFRPYLQEWDRRSAEGVDHFLANSRYIAIKLAWLYGRESQVVPPPVDVTKFASVGLEGGGRGGYFLWVGAFAPYKRLDIALEAFRQLGMRLWVAGSGSGLEILPSSVPSNVRMLGAVPDHELPELYRNARALVFTAEEDFGLVPLEAQAAGRPVIAFGAGGALETVNANTGIFFPAQTGESVADAVRSFDQWEKGFVPSNARENAARYSKEVFKERFGREVNHLLGLLRRTE